jgi:4-amino-4-deoxy-L-arabinose transferase-like glycosyltransferase
MHGSEHRWLWRGLTAAVIFAAAVLHVLYLLYNCPLALAPDEAHYWDWSRHLDWSYYSKGPLVALIIRGSCALFGPLSESLTGNLALAIRLPAIVCGMLLLSSLYVLTVQTSGRDRLAFSLVALALTLPPVAAVSTLMTIDAPYTACWGWALVFGHLAAVRGKAWAWPVVGVIVGVGILAKYTMALWLPSVGLFLLISPSTGRARLLPSQAARRGRSLALPSGFWLACVIAAAFCLPIFYWNWQHDWVTVRHVGWQAGVEQRTGWRWFGPLVYVGGQAALLMGVWFVIWAVAMWECRPPFFSLSPWERGLGWGVHRPPFDRSTPHPNPPPQGEIGHEDERWEQCASRGYLWWLSAPMFCLFLLASLKTTGQLNWPVTAYLSGGVLATVWLEARLRQSRRGRLIVAGTAVVGVALSLVVHFPGLGRPVLTALAGAPTAERPLPMRRFDPSCRLRGWPALAAAVDLAAEQVRAGGEEPVIVAGSWILPGELGVYCAGRPTVYTIGVVAGDRASQYDLWRPNPVLDPAVFRGRTFVLVSCPDPIARQAFDAAEPPRAVVYAEGDQPIQSWTVTVARGFHGFPGADQALRTARH